MKNVSSRLPNSWQRGDERLPYATLAIAYTISDGYDGEPLGPVFLSPIELARVMREHADRIEALTLPGEAGFVMMPDSV